MARGLDRLLTRAGNECAIVALRRGVNELLSGSGNALASLLRLTKSITSLLQGGNWGIDMRLHLRVVEILVRVEDDKHALVQLTEKLAQGVFQVELAAIVVHLQILEEVDEHVRVALVNDAIGLLEQLVELQLRCG